MSEPYKDAGMSGTFLRCCVLCLAAGLLLLTRAQPVTAGPSGTQPPVQNANDSTQVPSSAVAPSLDSTSQAQREREERAMKEIIEEEIFTYGPMADGHIAYLNENSASTKHLALLMLELAWSRRQDALPVLEKVLLRNPRPGNRAAAAKAVGIVAKYTRNLGVIASLEQTLSDSVTDVQWNATKVLYSLGDTTATLPTVFRIARGVDKVNWSVEWGYYMGLEHMSQEQITTQKGRMRDAMQIEAIRILGRLGTKEAVETLRDLEPRLDGVRRPSRVAMEVLGALRQAGQQSVRGDTIGGGAQ